MKAKPVDQLLTFPNCLVDERTRQLIVLVPEERGDDIELARQVWRLAAPTSLPVLYLAIPPRDGQMSSLHHQLATLVNLTAGEQAPVRSKIAKAHDWVEAVAREWQPGDLVVCYENQYSAHWAHARRRVCEHLKEELNLPIHVLSGPRAEGSLRWVSYLRETIFWSASAAILAGFGWFQFLLQQSLPRMDAPPALVLSVLVEIGAIVTLNQWLG